MKKIGLIILASVVLVFNGCNYNKTVRPKEKLSVDSLLQLNNALTLEDFVVKSGNIITKKIYPPIIHAEDVAYEPDKILFIDIRPEAQYEEGHIDGAWHVEKDSVLDFLKDKNVEAYKKIVIVGTYGPIATYTAALLRFYGYDNAYALKFGMAGWNKDFAKYIKPFISNKYANKLDTVSVPIPVDSAGAFPLMPEMPFDKLLETQVRNSLALEDSSLIVSAEKAFSGDSNMFVVAYWTEGKYRIGHIPGSIRYQPRVDLAVDKYLNTLPVYKDIVVYCNTGHHAAAITAYLRLLGYNAKFIMFGANSFMNEYLAKFFPGAAITNTESISGSFPYIKGKNRTSKKAVKIKAVQSAVAVPAIKPVVHRKKKQEGGGGCE